MDSITSFCKAIFPGYCALCGIPNGTICPRCYRKLIRALPSCPICGKLSSNFMPHNKCIEDQESIIARSYLCWQQNRTVEEILHKVNHNNLYGILSFLTIRCTDILKRDDVKNSIIVGLPSTNSEYIERGFISSDIIAKSLSKSMRLQYYREIPKQCEKIMIVNDVQRYKRIKKFAREIRSIAPEAEIISFSLFNQVHKIRDMQPVKT